MIIYIYTAQGLGYNLSMLNTRQVDLAEKFLVNTANGILIGLILGNLVRPHEFNLPSFIMGCILFAAIVIGAFWLRKGGEPK